MTKWYEDKGADNSIVISSRVRLARNLSNYLFPMKITESDSEKMIDEVIASVNKKDDLFSPEEKLRVIDYKSYSPVEKQSLLEKHIISPLFFMDKANKALMLRDNESASIMINEEDHIRIQSILPGDNIEKAYETADRLDDILEESVDYAYDKDYGYLTACPTNTGTGLRVSYMLHLPALETMGKLTSLIPSISKLGFVIRGIHGEGSAPMGGIYQISNQMTMGHSEKEIVSSLKTFVKSITEEENAGMQRLFHRQLNEMDDKIHRSYGILTNAKKVKVNEAMSLLSTVRIGYNSGVLKKKRPNKTIYNIMMDIQPGNIELFSGKDLSEEEKEIERAKYIQKCFEE